MYGRWRYGDAGDRYPVAPGEEWVVGPHVVAAGDLEAGDLRAFAARHGPFDMLYSDPPWNAGNARAFRTKAAVPRAVNFPAFLRTIFAVAAEYVDGPVFVEMGRASAERAIEIAVAAGLAPAGSVEITYYRTKPAVLLRFNAGAHPSWPSAFAGVDDVLTPALAMRTLPRPGLRVLDPCMGLGQTALSAHETGNSAYGLELHPRRLAVTLDRLAAAGAGTPYLNRRNP